MTDITQCSLTHHQILALTENMSYLANFIHNSKSITWYI